MCSNDDDDDDDEQIMDEENEIEINWKSFFSSVYVPDKHAQQNATQNILLLLCKFE